MVSFPRRKRRALDFALIRDIGGKTKLEVRDDTGALVNDSVFGQVGGSGFNVRSYGAVGDGIVDDTKPIKEACDAAAVSGGVVYFPKGVYMTDPQTHYSNVIWDGDGPDISIVRLRPGSNNDLLKTKDYDILTGTNPSSNSYRGCRGHGLRNITLDANRTQQTSRSRCYVSYGWNHTVDNVWFVNGHTIGVTSEWVTADGGPDHMEALWRNFKVWNYGGVKGGAIGLDWSGPHDSMMSNFIVATLDSTIRPYHATYGANPINVGTTPTATTPNTNGTQFTFTTTQAAPTDLFPETGGSFLVPVANSFTHIMPITYTSASTVGSVTTFSGCTSATGRVIDTSVTNVGIIKPSYGLLVNRIQRGEYALLATDGHVWGRNHIGVCSNVLQPPFNLDATIAMTNCHIEGSFLANTIMTTNGTFIGGSIYGTNGQTGNEYEVGMMLSTDGRGAEALQVNTVMFNLGKAGGPVNCAPIVNANSASFMLRVTGTTSTTSFFRSANVYTQLSDVLIICRNDANKSVQYSPGWMTPVFHGGIRLGGSGVRITSGDADPTTQTLAGVVGDLYIRRNGATVGGLIYRATAVTGTNVSTWTAVL